MQPLIIFIRAIGIYALLTIPVLFAPVIYIISMYYVIVFGWIAFALFLPAYYLILHFIKPVGVAMPILSLVIIISVALAFHVLGLCYPHLEAWNSEGFLLFPAAGALAGIISLFISKNKIIATQTQQIN